MEATRAYVSNNRGMLINILYVVVFVIALYYLYLFLVKGNELEVQVLNGEAVANKPAVYTLPKNPEVRVKQGGEYTISFWMYIHSWDYRSGLP